MLKKPLCCLLLILFPFYGYGLKNTYLTKSPPSDYIKKHRSLYWNWLETHLSLKAPDTSCFSEWKEKTSPSFDFFPNSLTSFFIEFRAEIDLPPQWFYTLLATRPLNCLGEQALGAKWSFDGKMISKFYSVPPQNADCPQTKAAPYVLFEISNKDSSCWVWNLKPESSALSLLEERFVVDSYIETSKRKLYFIKTFSSLNWPQFPSDEAYKIKKDWRKRPAGISIDSDKSYILYWL